MANKLTKNTKSIPMSILSVVVALAIIFPIIWLVCSSFKQTN